MKKEAFVQKPDIAHLKPRFEDWRLIKAQALVTGKLLVKSGKLKVEFRLWDLAAAKEMSALAFTTTPSNWRRVAHIISDKIYERLTGEDGYFDTRIIFVAESGPKNQRVKKLAIMDQDGANTKYLTLGNELVLTQDLIQQIRWLLTCLILGICLEYIFLTLKLAPKRLLGIFLE